jgi:hypothetical protein
MTNRRRVQRARKLPVSDACIEAFREWRQLEDQCDCDDQGTCCACKRRRELHKIVSNEMQLKPWQIWYRDPYLVGFLTRAAAVEG